MEDVADAWETLGGMVCDGICTYVADHIEFETNKTYASIIEKKAEEIYKIVSHKQALLPNSVNACHTEIPSAGIELTPQESEQLSEYVADDTFVKKQKEDVEKLSQIYKSILGQYSDDANENILKSFEKAFKAPEDKIKAVCCIKMSDTDKTIVLDFGPDKVKVYYGEAENPDMTATTTKDMVNRIISGKTTFQGAFMSGFITAKGRLDLIRMFDRIFVF